MRRFRACCCYCVAKILVCFASSLLLALVTSGSLRNAKQSVTLSVCKCFCMFPKVLESAFLRLLFQKVNLAKELRNTWHGNNVIVVIKVP